MLSLKSFKKKTKKNRASDWQVTDLWASSAPPVIHHEGTVLTSTSLFKHSGARAESSLASTWAPLKYFANTDLQHCKVSNNDKNSSIFLTSAKNKKLQTAAQPLCVYRPAPLRQLTSQEHRYTSKRSDHPLRNTTGTHFSRSPPAWQLHHHTPSLNCVELQNPEWHHIFQNDSNLFSSDVSEMPETLRQTLFSYKHEKMNNLSSALIINMTVSRPLGFQPR